MCRNSRRRSANRQRAFSLVPALFLLIVLAALGIVAVRITAVESQTVVLGMQSARAYAAAKTGIDWAAYRALVGGSCAADTLTLSEGGAAGFVVDATCSASSHSEGSATVTVYTIEVFARSGTYGTPDYVSRRLRATVTDAS